MDKNFTIVGTGVTGTAVLIELARQLKKLHQNGTLPQKITITTVERYPLNGPGYPYDPDSCHPEHLLNHPASEMAIKPIDKDGNDMEVDFEVSGWQSYDFVRWIQEKKSWILKNYPEIVNATYPGMELEELQPDPKQFYSRQLYGFYMQERFKEAVRNLKDIGVKVTSYNNTEATEGNRVGEQFSLTLKDLTTGKKTQILTNRLLLATGSWKKDNNGPKARSYFDNPYPAISIVDAIKPSVPKEGKVKRIIIQGMGLSALDTILSMATGKFYRNSKGELSYHPGKHHPQIIATSRSGYFPAIRGMPAKIPKLKVFTQEALDKIKNKNGGYLTLTDLKILGEKELKEQFGNKFEPLDYFRPNISAEEKLKRDLKLARKGNVIYCLIREVNAFKWSHQLAPEDKEYFIKNLQSEFYRNISAMPVLNAEKLIALLETGALTTIKLGFNKTSLKAEDNKIRLDYSDIGGQRKTLYGDYMIKAEGYEVNIEKNSDPLIKSLLKQREIISNKAPYHDINKGLAINYTEEQRQAIKSEDAKILEADMGGIKVNTDNYSVIRTNEKGVEEKSNIISALGFLVMNWTDRAFASASIKDSRLIVKNWIDDLPQKHAKTPKSVS
jgi:uncharacterized NAD(P)/FAD-binding protein YdhS